MTSLALPKVQAVEITADTFSANLSDGCSIAVPLAWYPRLLQASTVERHDWRLIGGGSSIHWHQLDKDISVANIILGQPEKQSIIAYQAMVDMVRVAGQSACKAGYANTKCAVGIAPHWFFLIFVRQPYRV